jgi:hypothetical protein
VEHTLQRPNAGADETNKRYKTGPYIVPDVGKKNLENSPTQQHPLDKDQKPQSMILPQKVQHSPAEQEENHHPTPEYPLVLARPSLHHSDGIAAYAESVCNAVQSPLGTLEHFALLS